MYDLYSEELLYVGILIFQKQSIVRFLPYYNRQGLVISNFQPNMKLEKIKGTEMNVKDIVEAYPTIFELSSIDKIYLYFVG